MMDWELVYRKHSAGVFQYLLHMTRHNQEAEDLLQETFVKAIRSAEAIREPEKVRSWLLTIARNLFLDLKKKQNRFSGVNIDASSPEELNLKAKDDNPEELAVKGDFALHLNQVVNDLSEAHQTAFSLGILQRLSYKEIEEITGWSPAVVKINIYRVRKKISGSMRMYLE
jgi:RNA polymerase sigma factor (sigma-70 family)